MYDSKSFPYGLNGWEIISQMYTLIIHHTHSFNFRKRFEFIEN